MHEKGVSHRDIKPDNIMVSASDRKIKIIDFGIAKKYYSRKQKTDMLTITGTLFYRAP
jgi:serine/threonine protein kinase